jgi:hypothetical protein
MLTGVVYPYFPIYDVPNKTGHDTHHSRREDEINADLLAEWDFESSRTKMGKRRRRKSVPMCMPRTPSWNLLLSMHLYCAGVILASASKLQRAAMGVHWNAVPNKRSDHMISTSGGWSNEHICI